MADITVTANTSTISVDTTLNTVAVTSTPTTVTVGAATGVSNIAVRTALSVTDTGGDGSLTYANSTGIFTYTGPDQAEANIRIAAAPSQVRAHISNTAPILYDATTGVISANTDAIFSNTLANNWFTSQTTDDLTEGTTNLYLNGTGTTDDLTEGTTNKYYATSLFNTDFATKTTTDLTEGSNLYFTTARARQSISATSPLSYDSGTGVISISEIGDIESVTAGTGLTGGGNSGNVTLNVGSGYGITVNADNIELTNSIVQAQANIAIGNNTTDNLTEGSTNLYFTNARTNTVISTNTTDNLTEGSTNLYFTNARTNTVISTNTTDNLSEGSTNLYYTQARFDTAFGNKTTSDLTEGTNLYYTTGRANSAIVDYIGTASNAPFAFGGNVTVNGDVIVAGNLDYENVTDLYVQDQKITLNANAATDATVQIIANRPVAGTNTYLQWNETSDEWQFTNDGANIYHIPAGDISGITLNAYETVDNTVGIHVNTPQTAGSPYMRYNANYDRWEFQNNTSSGGNFVLNGGDFRAVNLGLAGNTDGGYFAIQDNGANVEFINRYPNFIEHADKLNIATDEQASYANVYFPFSKKVGGYSNVNDSFNEFVTASQLISFQAGSGHLYLKGELQLKEGTTGGHYYDGGILLPNKIRSAEAGATSFITLRDHEQAETNVDVTVSGIANAHIIIDNNADDFSNVTYFAVEKGTTTDANTANTAELFKVTRDGAATFNNAFTLPTADGSVDQVLTTDGSGTVSFASPKLSLIDVYNNTGNTLTKGQAVYLNGAETGDNPHVDLADSDDSSKMPAIGLVKENIAHTAVGQVVTSGEMNYSSHGFTLGGDLYIDTTPGGLTTTKPTTEAKAIQKIGKVVGTNHVLVQGAFRTNQTPNLNQGNIFLGDTNNQTRTVTPDSNFDTTGNAFSLSNTLTDVNNITSENNQSASLITKGSDGYAELNREIDGVETVGLEADSQGYAMKSLTMFNAMSASTSTQPVANVTGLICTAGGTVTFKAGSNVVQITGIYTEVEGNGGSAIPVADVYQDGMALVNFGLVTGGEGNKNRPVTYPLSIDAVTTSLANSTTRTANVIMSETAPFDWTWDGNWTWDRGLFHILKNSTTGRKMVMAGTASLDPQEVTHLTPIDRNDYFVNDTGTNSTAEFDTSSVPNFTGANVSMTGFSDFYYSSARRQYKKTSLRSTKGSTSFSNVVLIGNDAGYDDSGFGYNYWPTFGMTTLWNGTDSPGNDTGAAQNPSITPGLRFIQFTDKTIQGTDSANLEEVSTGGPRILLNSSQGNISLNPAEYYPREYQGLGVFGVYGSTQTNPFPRTRSQLPGGIYFTASENWTANTGTDAYFVSTPQGKVGTDTDANEAHLFLASNNGETTLLGTNKVSFYQSANAFSAGNIVGGYNAIKSGVEWANISSTGIQTGGTIQGDNTVLKKFNETKVDLGSVSGDQSIALNADNGSIYTLTATGGITINNIANAVAGTSMTIIITQDGTGSHALTSSMKFAGGDKTLSTAPNSIDVISVFYDGTTYYASLTKAYA